MLMGELLQHLLIQHIWCHVCGSLIKIHCWDEGHDHSAACHGGNNMGFGSFYSWNTILTNYGGFLWPHQTEPNIVHPLIPSRLIAIIVLHRCRLNLHDVLTYYTTIYFLFQHVTKLAF
jgi:hypothetical protein